MEFANYVKKYIKNYLPADYADAEVMLETVRKTNNRELTGLVILRPEEVVVPTVYLERFEAASVAGKPIEEVMTGIAQIYLNHCQTVEFDKEVLTDYEKAKPLLEISLCDPENNERFLEGKAYTLCGAFAAVYRIQALREGDDIGVVEVTDELMDLWGVSLKDLHRDAVAAENRRDPARLCRLDDLMRETFTDCECRNLFYEKDLPIPVGGVAMFALTNGSKVNGAAVLARDGILEKIGEILGQDYFVLPSSLHELLLVPDNGTIGWAELTQMVQEVNNTQVSIEDLLSYKVQRYDRAKQALQQNPMKAAS